MSIIVRQYKNAGKAALLILCVSALLSSVAAETHAPEASAANESAEPSPPKQEPLTLENAVYMLQNPFRYSHEAEIFYQGKRQQIYIGMGNCAASLDQQDLLSFQSVLKAAQDKNYPVSYLVIDQARPVFGDKKAEAPADETGIETIPQFLANAWRNTTGCDKSWKPGEMRESRRVILESLLAYIQSGGDINTQNPLDQATGLHTCLSPSNNNSLECSALAEYMLLYGADPLRTDKSDNTPLHGLFNFAHEADMTAPKRKIFHSDCPNPDAYALLVRYGADINGKNAEGNTPRRLKSVCEGLR